MLLKDAPLDVVELICVDMLMAIMMNGTDDRQGAEKFTLRFCGKLLAFLDANHDDMRATMRSDFGGLH